MIGNRNIPKLSMIILLIITGCAGVSTGEPRPLMPTITATIRNESSPIPSVTPIQTVAVTPTFVKTKTPTAIPSLSPTITSTSVECNQLIQNGLPSIIGSGTVLFTDNHLPGLWGIFKGATEPKMIFDPAIPQGMLSPVNLSKDGMKIAWEDYENAPKQLIIDDLGTKQRTRYDWQDSWKYIVGWTDDGRIILLISDKAVYGEGVTNKFQYFNLQTQVIEEVTKKLDLPGYDFNGGGNPLGGVFTIDPTGRLVLYTAVDNTLTNWVILRDINSGHEFWKFTAKYITGGFTPPEWTRDGNWVVMTLRKDEDGYIKIFRLSRDGTQFEELTHHSLSEYPNYLIRDLSVSPDGRYIYFSIWLTVSDGPGYILDTVTSEIREICTYGQMMTMNARWLPTGNQLIFLVRQGNYPDDIVGKLTRQELRILDVDSWTSQTLAVAGSETSRFQIMGWTPLVFP